MRYYSATHRSLLPTLLSGRLGQTVLNCFRSLLGRTTGRSWDMERSGKVERSGAEPDNATTFMFLDIPYSQSVLLRYLQEIPRDERQEFLQICLPTETPPHKMLQFVRNVYQCCATNRLKNVICLLYQPSTTRPATTDSFNEEQQPFRLDEVKQYKNTVLGGTFDRLHYGHMLMLSEAAILTKERLSIGLTTSELNKSKTLCEFIEPWNWRAENIERFIRRCKPMLQVQISHLMDIYGPALDRDQELIVVTEETARNVPLVQGKRSEYGLQPLSVHIAQLIRCGHNKISSSANRNKLIGRLIRKPRRNDAPVYVIGLTGPTCSGKSSVGRILTRLGALVIDCDAVAHNTYEPGSRIYQKLIQEFGVQILQERTSESVDPPINRKVLGALVFGHEENMSTLCTLVWPEMKIRLKREIQNATTKVVVLDAAILLQAGLWDLVHEVWVCGMDREACIQRLMRSRRLTYSDAAARTKPHLPDEEYVRWANVLISTKGTEEETTEIVANCWSELLTRIDVHPVQSTFNVVDYDIGGHESDDEGDFT